MQICTEIIFCTYRTVVPTTQHPYMLYKKYGFNVVVRFVDVFFFPEVSCIHIF